MDSKQSGLNCEVVILQGVNLSRIVESMSVDLICESTLLQRRNHRSHCTDAFRNFNNEFSLSNVI